MACSLLRSALKAASGNHPRSLCLKMSARLPGTITNTLMQGGHARFQFAGFHSTRSTSMIIQTQDTPNPASLKFLPGKDVLTQDSISGFFYQKSERKAWQSQSPLARKVFAIDGVTAVFIGQDFITVSKHEEESWQALRPQVFSALMDFYAEGLAAVTDEPQVTDTTILDTDSEVVMMIKELLEERIRPAVQEDGGDIFFHKFDEATGTVWVQLAGACSGCPSSSVTLKNGVENMMMHYIPEVKAIEEYVDEELVKVNEQAVSSLEERIRKAGIPFD
eukprot:CAMPEP_0194570078 /NCGR_PEP_ID=MMETSP0292-20121207/7536_1 /TAXON_ID=39354 /ORGANISM="Heterosigma akashiwo, Strain CCMP2393" /LENGTH=276 /DNA_ID=CAMNT_0039420453 /DNA_START=21 /DNA_END=851 /DNA_ORIENTATION=-